MIPYIFIVTKSRHLHYPFNPYSNHLMLALFYFTGDVTVTWRLNNLLPSEHAANRPQLNTKFQNLHLFLAPYMAIMLLRPECKLTSLGALQNTDTQLSLLQLLLGDWYGEWVLCEHCQSFQISFSTTERRTLGTDSLSLRMTDLVECILASHFCSIDFITNVFGHCQIFPARKNYVGENMA